MRLSDLPSSEIARIDAICSEYESNYRRGNAPEIETLVARYGGNHAELLREQLELARDELQSNVTVDASRTAAAANAGRAEFDVPPTGTRLGPYIVGDTIGRGGMGVVLAAVDERLGRRVAIKMLSGHVARHAELAERFDREARAVAAISHPNIVELFDVGTHNGLPYAVMEFLNGELLSDRLRRTEFTAAETRRMGAQIADALSRAHDAGVIHRDLKPQNVMLTRARDTASAGDADDPETLVKLIDFGLSRAPQDARQSEIDATEQGMILGTPGYMAPEQALGEPATEAADMFALGCILYETFYGRRAFDGSSGLNRHEATLVETSAPDPIRRRTDIELAMLIDECLAKNPDDRPSSAAEIARHLRGEHAVDRLTATTATEFSAGRFSRRRLIELGVGGITGGLIASIYAARYQHPLVQINSIGVLSFHDGQLSERSSAGTIDPPRPVGTADLSPGEELAAMLTHELSRLPSVVVPPFRPLAAYRPSQYRQAAELLEVDALLTGSIHDQQVGQQTFQVINLSIVSAADGTELWGEVFETKATESFLQRSQLAADIADKIGRRLTTTADSQAPPAPAAFRCLVDGRVRCDPDSREGLEMALKCFQRAHRADVRYAEPLAGIALTAITLAGQSEIERAVELIQTARDATQEALSLSPSSFAARLASAMLDWQTIQQYDLAEQKLRRLQSDVPNRWQVHHQFGLLQLARGRREPAIESLGRAALLNPLSVTVKTDLARAYWFAGQARRARIDAERVHDRYRNHPLAQGLLVDMLEQQQDYQTAQAVFGEPVGNLTAERYFVGRRRRLSRLPYGPFGAEINKTILDIRSGVQPDDRSLADLADPLPPMLMLVLSGHPTFESARRLPRSKEMLARLRTT